ncbi:ribonuclease Z [Planctomycetes bacterium Poly30]|uniref:Ribonuclease Z n=1 Tax=Saltatorellus ferox TaxID=2528018 RepID=A0A518EN36_9BACT|nr:ribonuclease Z [Planctomycetes bacterium Poly30]
MIDLDGLHVGGYSLGGFASCLDIPTFKVAVDIGICLDRVISRDLILITHAHVDHLGAIAQHVAQRGLRRMEPATYLVPPGIEDQVEELLRAWRGLDGGALAANVVSLAPGERFQVRQDLAIRPFRTRHRVVSQGYFFERTTKRLAEEFQGLPPDEIRDLRLAGTEVSVPVRSIDLAVTGDTRLDAVLENPEVAGAERLVLECTFFDDRIDVEEARHRGHVHIDEVAEAAAHFSGRALLLNHVSPRHARADARRIMAEKLPPELLERTRLMVGAED